MRKEAEKQKKFKWSYADAAKPISPPEINDEKASLLENEVVFLGTYSHAIEISNGHPPPSYDEVHPQSKVIPPRPPTPPSTTTLISLYAEPIRVEYEESERLHRYGCGNFLWNYYACCGMIWTIIGCICCALPIIYLFFLYFYI